MERVFAIILLAALAFQLGTALGLGKDPRPMTPTRGASILAGLVVVACGVVLAVTAL